MQFFKELAAKIQSFKYKRPLFKCKAFEDNNGAIAIATTENLRPRTKHINIKYHHFKRTHWMVKNEIRYSSSPRGSVRIWRKLEVRTSTTAMERPLV